MSRANPNRWERQDARQIAVAPLPGAPSDKRTGSRGVARYSGLVPRCGNGQAPGRPCVLPLAQAGTTRVLLCAAAMGWLASAALAAGKHVLVEKPLTDSARTSQLLVDEARARGLVLQVDHTYVYSAPVQKIRSVIGDGELGDLLYIDSVRINLGLFQSDVNVVWDLAPHDLSVLDYLINETPSAVVATGKAHYGKGLEDIAYITIYFPNDIIAHVNVNWLSPVKVRQTLMGGKKKMLVWNDINVDEKIKVYDKGVEITNREGRYKLLVSYRSGDMWAPKVCPTEALKIESEYFIDCILNDKTPINDGQAGLRIVKILEAADKSMKKREELVYL